MPRRRVVLGGFLLGAGVLLAAGPPARAEEEVEPERPAIYKWVDENGVAHYTTDADRIPSALRGGLRRLGPAADDAGATADSPTDTDWWVLRDAPSETRRSPAGVDPVLQPYAPPDPREVARRAEQLLNLDEQIALLEGEISRDEESLKDMISDPAGAQDPLALGNDPEFREVARRLPKLQSDLEALRDERERLEGP